MYTVRFQLELNASEKRFLSKSFFYANQMHNQIVRHTTSRLNALFHDKEYMDARKACDFPFNHVRFLIMSVLEAIFTS